MEGLRGVVVSQVTSVRCSALVVAVMLLSRAWGDAPASRTVNLVYRVLVKDIPSQTKEVRVWIPYPTEDAYQHVSEVTIHAPVDSRLTHESAYRNRMIYFCVKNPALKVIPFDMQFVITRKEHVNELLRNPKAKPAKKREKISPRLVQADQLAPVTGEVKDLSDQVTNGKTSTVDKVRAIYDYVLQHMVYDKSGTGWGRGDTRYACEVGKGNCTDYHALFISMARAQGIPAKFEIGFSLPVKRGEGIVAGYHCWAQCYVEGLGWIPVDCSEADKQSDKTDYFFGAHDENRILLSTGRDLVLSPKQHSQPLNYFVFPYVEIDGQPHPGVQSEVSYKDVQ